MLLEDNKAFTTPVSPRKAVWEPDPAFDDASYADRYVIFFERMVRERLLDAACVVLRRQGLCCGEVPVGVGELPGVRGGHSRQVSSVHGHQPRD